MPHLRLYFKQLGGHIHCRLFVGPAKHLTHAKSGDLVFDEKEWPDVKDTFQRIAEVLPDDH